jgi:hypothetical protein
MEVCMEHDIPIVVSCDNKTDQLEQFYSRIKIDFSNTNAILLKAGDKNFKKDLKDNLKITKKIIIFCLDNNAQISKGSYVLDSSGGINGEIIIKSTGFQYGDKYKIERQSESDKKDFYNT